MTYISANYRLPVHPAFHSRWHRFFLADAFFVSGKSKDRSTQCGCVIATEDNDVIVRGWNDLPRGVKDRPERRERPTKYLWTEHAERNAIYNAARLGVSLKGSTIYITRVPCPDCARAIIQAGVKKVVTMIGPREEEFRDRMNTRVSIEMFGEVGVEVVLYDVEIHEQLAAGRYRADL